MNALVLLAGVLAALTQARAPSARELLNTPRPLTEREIAGILSLSQEALTGKVFRLPWMGRKDGGPDILMGPRGHPRIIRWSGEIQGGGEVPRPPAGLVASECVTPPTISP